MNFYQIYQATGTNRGTEIEHQPREYAGFVHAESLEQAFEYSQNEDEDWSMNEVQSTSVGDVIRFEETFYMVCGTGFKLLEYKIGSVINNVEFGSLSTTNSTSKYCLSMEIQTNKDIMLNFSYAGEEDNEDVAYIQLSEEQRIQLIKMLQKEPPSFLIHKTN